MKTEKIKLNIPCPYCNKEIYLNEEIAYTKEGVYHLECYFARLKDKVKKLNNILMYDSYDLENNGVLWVKYSILRDYYKEIEVAFAEEIGNLSEEGK